MMVSRIRNRLEGRTYGRLLVLALAPDHVHKENGRTHWLCRCTCGSESYIDGSSLIRGKTRSCGCLRSETSRNKALMQTRAEGHFV